MKSHLNTTLFFLLFSLGLFSCEIIKNDDPVLELEEDEEIVIQDTVFTLGLRHIFNNELSDSGSSLDWDWEQGETIVTYLDDNGGIVEDTITLPWFTQGSPLNVVNPDIQAEKGWSLLMRDFGTEKRGIGMPYLSLHNRSTDQLLLTIRNVRTLAGNFAQGKITFKSLSGEDLGSFVSGKEKFNQFDGWFIFRFDLKGTEVDLSGSSMEILFEGVGVSETRIQF
ncbi:hypothetical protein Aoki45_17880 [Algoriphagus sp. oki45]|uniref:hypothetical protein n=1 Tax=Algoriphagus sp. oki45 TaxID=3067294 RepID=UPI0028002F01|nr:hypothetical protein Aoki45_17880 [Algoriphagus sp. oki45]